MHDLSVIVTLAGALAVALVLGWVTRAVGLSTLVGYILAGVVVGPFTPGFVADARLAQQMAEIGVILLMFSVGMHFHPQELLRVKRIAVPGAIVQSLFAGIAGWALARWAGWSNVAGAVFGMALAVASTVVLMRMLIQEERLGARDGHVAVGWLIVEDLFTVVALVVLPALAAQAADPAETAFAIGKAIALGAVFAVSVWFVGIHLLAPVMERIARTRSSELLTLTVFVIALGIAMLAAAVFNMSVALGAFFAGLVVGQSRIGPQAAADMAPFRDVFSALFFVSIGMLFDPEVLRGNPALLAMALGIVLVVKPLAALLIVVLLRDTLRTALTVAVGLAQIGEFSFILAALGNSLEVLPAEATNVLVAAAIVSIALNPLLFRLLPRIEARFGKRWQRGAEEPQGAPVDTPPASDESAPAVVITGLGELGRRLVERSIASATPVCVVDDNLERLEAIQTRGVSTVFGDPGREPVLEAARVAAARVIVVTNPSLPVKVRICSLVRKLNPRISIIATAESAAERAWLREFGVAYVADVYDDMSDSLVRAVRRML